MPRGIMEENQLKNLPRCNRHSVGYMTHGMIFNTPPYTDAKQKGYTGDPPVRVRAMGRYVGRTCLVCGLHARRCYQTIT